MVNAGFFFCALSVVAAAPPRGLDARRPEDGRLRFSDATFLASHNAHAALQVAEGLLEPLGANQDDDILHQLREDGVRGLLLDLALDEDQADPLRLVHASSFLSLDYGGFRTVLGSNVIPFLEENDDAVVSFFLQTVGDTGSDAAAIRGAILEQLRAVFSSMTVRGVALRDMTFKYDDARWAGHGDWPTLAELRAAGQRLFVFSDRSEFADAALGFMFNRQVLSENHWEGIEDCTALYMWRYAKVSLPGNDSWSRLFFMNHFCCGSGPDARDDTIGDNLLGGGNNGWGVLYPRVRECMANNGGFKPNFIALDWVAQSEEAREIRDYLNFEGRLGTGQACAGPSDCATASCNVVRGVCQCRQCPAEGEGTCLGCDVGQYCDAPGGGEVNTCQDKEGYAGPQPSTPQTPAQSDPGASGLSDPGAPAQSGPAPTQSPTPLSQYCGEEYFAALASCNDAVQCPGGNDDCPDGQTCYAGVDCTPYPTASPRPTPSPSRTESARPSFGEPALRPILLGPAGGASAAPAARAPAAVASWLAELGVTGSPLGPAPVTPGPSPATPAVASQYYCGANFTDARENCRTNAPCPNGSPGPCRGGTCYGGIACLAPPTPFPTPTTAPTMSPEQAGDNAGENRPPGSPSVENPPQGGPSGENQPQGWDSWSGGGSEPFNLDTFQNRESCGNRFAPDIIGTLIMIAIGFSGLTF